MSLELQNTSASIFLAKNFLGMSDKTAVDLTGNLETILKECGFEDNPHDQTGTEQAEAFQASKFGVASAAAGGEIIGPGSGTSDSIPAMLSDGEFVMTAEAVRNAGGGDRNLGAARMYDTMNRLERAV